MAKRGAVVKEIDICDLQDGEKFTETLDAFISRLQALRDKIPGDRRESAAVEIAAYGDYAHTYVDVKY